MYDFGITEEQFLQLTPAKFAALSERHDYSVHQAEFRAGLICSIIANANRDEKKRPQPYTAYDFVPRYDEGDDDDPPRPKPAAPEMTDEQVLRYMKAAFPKRKKEARG